MPVLWSKLTDCSSKSRREHTQSSIKKDERPMTVEGSEGVGERSKGMLDGKIS